MPDLKSSDAKPSASAPTKAAPVKPELTPAGESGNPAVHQLLAELETHRSNGDLDEVQDIVDYLATLGFSAG